MKKLKLKLGDEEHEISFKSYPVKIRVLVICKDTINVIGDGYVGENIEVDVLEKKKTLKDYLRQILTSLKIFKKPKKD